MGGVVDHLAGAGDRRIVELEVHEDLGSAATVAGGGRDVSGERAGRAYGESARVSIEQALALGPGAGRNRRTS